MPDRRFWYIVALTAGVYAFVAYLLVTQRAPFSFTEIFDVLNQQFTSLYSWIFVQ
jgi:hypothetical protein